MINVFFFFGITLILLLNTYIQKTGKSLIKIKIEMENEIWYNNVNEKNMTW